MLFKRQRRAPTCQTQTHAHTTHNTRPYNLYTAKAKAPAANDALNALTLRRNAQHVFAKGCLLSAPGCLRASSLRRLARSLTLTSDHREPARQDLRRHLPLLCCNLSRHLAPIATILLDSGTSGTSAPESWSL